MDITKLATKMLLKKLGGGQQGNAIESVLGSLLGGGSSSDKSGIDLGAIIGNMKNSGMADVAESWLGKGENASISSSQLENLLGADKVQEAASQLGANSGDLLEKLQDVLPNLVDTASPNGDLLDSVGGLGGLAKLAGKFLGR